MQATFYKGFRKRENSTKRPSGGDTLKVLLKAPTDVHSPTLEIATGETNYNYFTFNGSYYFVVGATAMPNGYVAYTGEIDAMAECADDIKATKAFVERSGAGSTNLLDPFAPATTDNHSLMGTETTFFSLSESGTYVVYLANMPRPVAMSLGQFYELYQKLNSKDVIEQVENNFCDLGNLVTGAIWVPLDVPTMGSMQIKAGVIDTGLSASYLAEEVITKHTDVTLKLDNTILTSSAYASLTVHLPFVGAIQLSVDDFKLSKRMSITGRIDATTGAVAYYISGDSGLADVATFSGNCGVAMPVGSTSYNVSSFAGGFISAVGGIATGNVITAAGGIWAMFNGMRSTSQGGGGGTGSRAGVNTLRVNLTNHPVPEALTNKASVIGLPTMKTMTLGAINGYVKCVNASIESGADVESIRRANNYLNTGAWIE